LVEYFLELTHLFCKIKYLYSTHNLACYFCKWD